MIKKYITSRDFNLTEEKKVLLNFGNNEKKEP